MVVAAFAPDLRTDEPFPALRAFLRAVRLDDAPRPPDPIAVAAARLSDDEDAALVVQADSRLVRELARGRPPTAPEWDRAPGAEAGWGLKRRGMACQHPARSASASSGEARRGEGRGR